jgi:hypothetical protein
VIKTKKILCCKSTPLRPNPPKNITPWPMSGLKHLPICSHNQNASRNHISPFINQKRPMPLPSMAKYWAVPLVRHCRPRPRNFPLRNSQKISSRPY